MTFDKCSFFNRSKIRQNFISTIIRVLVRNLRAQSGIGNLEIEQRVSVQSEPSVPPQDNVDYFEFRKIWKFDIFEIVVPSLNNQQNHI